MRLTDDVTLNFNYMFSATVFLDIEKAFWYNMASWLAIQATKITFFSKINEMYQLIPN
jgi:hypothetical protein